MPGLMLYGGAEIICYVLLYHSCLIILDHLNFLCEGIRKEEKKTFSFFMLRNRKSGLKSNNV